MAMGMREREKTVRLVGQRTTRWAPMLGPVSGFPGTRSVVPSARVSVVTGKMRRQGGRGRLKVRLSLRKCHIVLPSASGTQKDHQMHTPS